MTRKQQETVDRSIWICPACTETECHQGERNPEPEPIDSQYAQTASKDTSLRILQINIDALLSKVEELKAFLKKHKIDAFAIQETKMIVKDKTPRIPGIPY